MRGATFFMRSLSCFLASDTLRVGAPSMRSCSACKTFACSCSVCSLFQRHQYSSRQDLLLPSLTLYRAKDGIVA